MKKRLLFTALLLLLFTGLFALHAPAVTIIDSGSCGTNVTWSLDSEGTLTISGMGRTHETFPLPWYSYNKVIKKVVVEEGITNIAYGAFSGCTSLTSVTIPDSVTAIGQSAFYGCTSLTAVTIPNSVIGIGSYAFSACSALSAINIPDSVTSVGVAVFHGCTSLISIELSENILQIPDGDGAYPSRGFWGNCTSLQKIVLPKNLNYLGSYALSGCTSLTSVTIGEKVVSIDPNAFSGCSALAKFEVNPNNTSYQSDSHGALLTKDGKNFLLYPQGNRSTAYTIPNGVTVISAAAFQNCSTLVSVTIPDSVTTIGYDAFYGCSALTAINIPDSVTTIGYDAFYGCSALTAIELPENLIQIPDGLRCGFFGNCTSLQRIVLPKNLMYLGSYAFYNCTSLTSVTIPNSITSISGYAFYNCSSLISIEMPDSITSIGQFAFNGCSALASIDFPDELTSIGVSAFSGCKSLTSIVIPDGVTYLWDGEVWQHQYGCFANCTSLTSVTLPKTMIYLGTTTFAGCSSLESITIPASVTSIGSNVFLYCHPQFSIYGYSGSTAETYAANNSITFVSLDGSAVAPAITTQPHGQFAGYNFVTYYAGDNATPMTVEAFAYADGTLSYAWYKADSAEGEGVKVGDTASCTPDVATVGTAYYYVVVTNTWTNINNITTTASTKSNVITVTVNSIAPNIQWQTSGTINCYPGSGAPTLSIGAYANVNGTLSYAWYRADSADAEGTKVGEGSTHVPDTTVAGTYYYYAVVTNTRTNDAGITVTAETKSSVITVIVHARSTLTGSYTSYDPDAPARIELLRDGNVQMATYSSSLGTGSGQATLHFTFTITTPGTYDLRIVKGGHLTATITGITVDGTSDVTLDPVTLPCGDVNGDGAINVADVALIRDADNYGKVVSDQIFSY